jgi:hypothetical protein
MFESPILIRELDTTNGLFSKMRSDLEVISDFHNCSRTGQVTSQADFPALYTATAAFYREFMPQVFHSCVPLYHSVWKHTFHSAAGTDNLHQDAGVQYFAANGYDARMLNIWICLHKVAPSSVGDDELGLYVIESHFPENKPLYEQLVLRNVHVSAKSPTTLVDNMQVAGQQVPFRRDTLRVTTFPYRTGTMITFSSHLLHGSKGSAPGICEAASSSGNYYRVALSSVWLQKDDLNPAVLQMPMQEYDSLYLWQHDRNDWPDLKRYFAEYCRNEERRVRDIGTLVQLHSMNILDARPVEAPPPAIAG